MKIKNDSALVPSRGRPRDESTKQAILGAALDIVREFGPSALTLDAIATRAETSRPTLYRWWSTKAEILLDAVFDVTQREVTYDHGGTLLNDLTQHATEYVALLTGPYGAAYRAIFAEGLADEKFMALVRTRLIEPRRGATYERLARAIQTCELPAQDDLNAVIDSLYAPFLYRLILGHQPLTAEYAETHINHIMKAML